MLAGELAVDDRVDDPGRAVDDVQRRVEAVDLALVLRELDRILVGHPAGVDAVHVDPVADVVGRRGPGQHIEAGLGHVRVGVPRGLEGPVELPLHRRDVDDVLVALGRPHHQRLELTVEDEGRDRVDEVDLQELYRRHLVEEEAPAVDLAVVDLLLVGVEHAGREEAHGRVLVLRQERDLAELRRAHRADHRRHVGGARGDRGSGDQLERLRGELLRAPLSLHQVSVEAGRASHRLAGVVDDEVEAGLVLQQLAAEELDAGRMPQIEPVDRQPVAPLREVLLGRVAAGRVVGEAGGHEHPRAGAEELDRRLVADLHPCAGDQRGPSREVAGPVAALEVELATVDAEVIVEVVERPVLGLADVAIARRVQLAGRLGSLGRRLPHQLAGRVAARRREDRRRPLAADRARVEHLLVGLPPLLLADGSLRPTKEALLGP